MQEIYSRIPEPYMALGYLSYQLEDYDKAIQFFKKAIDIDNYDLVGISE